MMISNQKISRAVPPAKLNGLEYCDLFAQVVKGEPDLRLFEFSLSSGMMGLQQPGFQALVEVYG